VSEDPGVLRHLHEMRNSVTSVSTSRNLAGRDANVGSLVALRVGQKDAELLGREFALAAVAGGPGS
jgi:hypothetical protein